MTKIKISFSTYCTYSQEITVSDEDYKKLLEQLEDENPNAEIREYIPHPDGSGQIIQNEIYNLIHSQINWKDHYEKDDYEFFTIEEVKEAQA